MGAFGTVAAQLGNDIANERDKRRADAADARTAAINERALALRQMLEQQRASDEHARAVQDQSLYDLDRQAKEQALKVSQQEYQIRAATLQHAGWTEYKDPVFDGKEKKWYQVWINQDTRESRKIELPGEPMSAYDKDRTADQRNPDIKSIEGWDYELDPERQLRGPRLTNDPRWVRIGRSKAPGEDIFERWKKEYDIREGDTKKAAALKATKAAQATFEAYQQVRALADKAAGSPGASMALAGIADKVLHTKYAQGLQTANTHPIMQHMPGANKPYLDADTVANIVDDIQNAWETQRADAAEAVEAAGAPMPPWLKGEAQPTPTTNTDLSHLGGTPLN